MGRQHAPLLRCIGLILAAGLLISGCAARPVTERIEARADGSYTGSAILWNHGHFPDELPARIAALPSVAAVVAVANGIAWLTGSQTADGRQRDAPPASLAIPIDVAAADPVAYARMVPGANSLATLRPGEVTLGQTAADLRGLGAGGHLVFRDLRLRVAAVVPDAVVGYAEVFATPGDAARLGVSALPYLLLRPAPRTSWTSLTEAIGQAAAPDSVRLRESGQARWLRDDDTLPVVLRKKLFGEFAADPNVAPGKWLAVDPRWEMEHLQTVRLPLIREIRCNRAIIAPLRAALEEIERRGLGDLITTQRGCYAPRRLFERNFVKLSNHAWGSAFDINVESNPFGEKPRQDPRIVEVFARHGFTWGGTWLVPDGMHFEWIGDR